MKILMVNKFLYPRGGAETYMLKIGDYLKNSGHEVEYFGMFDEKNIVFNSSNEYTKNMDFHSNSMSRLLYPFKIIYSFEAKKKMAKVIKKFNPDIIHMNNINFQLTPSIIDAAKKLNIPIVQTVHDYQMICPNHLLFNVNTKEICKKCVCGSKWNCFRQNCNHGSKIKSLIGTIEALLYNKKNTYSLVDRYICPSYFLEKMLLTNPIFKGKTKTIHNFIEIPDTKWIVDESGLMEKEDYVLFFGRLSEEKGLDIFIEACRRLPKIKFKIAGSGPMEEICKGIFNVEYVGFKTGKELDELIGRAQFSVYPSIWYENCPLSILESEALGTPVIANGWGGMMELIEDGKTGILIKEINSDNLTSTIEKLYLDKMMIRRLSINCLKTRNKLVSLDEYCKQMIEIYNSEKLKSLKDVKR